MDLEEIVRGIISGIAGIDWDEIGGAFISGLVSSPLINALFPFIVSLYFENSQSFPFLTKWLLRLIPFVILLVLFLAVIDSVESFIAGVIGLIFSILVFGSIGVSGIVVMVTIFVFAVIKIRALS